MYHQVIHGVWEEVARVHADELKGKVVDITVCDDSLDTPEARVRRFDESMERIRKMTAGSPPLRNYITAEDLYESGE